MRTSAVPADFSGLFHAEYAAILRTVYLIVGNRDEARDITQEAFTRLYTHWKKVRDYERPGAWLRRVAIRLATRSMNRQVILGRALEKIGVGASDPPAAHGELHAAILTLPRSQRAAVVLHYFDGLSVREVAGALGCVEATAKVHLHRARKHLRKLLGEEAVDVPG